MNLTIPLKKYLYCYVVKTYNLQPEQVLDLPLLVVPTIQNTGTIGGYFRKAEREARHYRKITISTGKPSREYKYGVVKYLEMCFRTTFLAYMEAFKCKSKDEKISQKTAIEHFCNYYGIALDDDIGLDCLRKRTQRNSVNRKNLIAFKGHDPLALLPHTVEKLLSLTVLAA